MSHLLVSAVASLLDQAWGQTLRGGGRRRQVKRAGQYLARRKEPIFLYLPGEGRPAPGSYSSTRVGKSGIRPHAQLFMRLCLLDGSRVGPVPRRCSPLWPRQWASGHQWELTEAPAGRAGAHPGGVRGLSVGPESAPPHRLAHLGPTTTSLRLGPPFCGNPASHTVVCEPVCVCPPMMLLRPLSVMLASPGLSCSRN